MHLDNVDPAVLVEIHGYGIADLRLGGKELDVKTRFNLKGLQSTLRAVRRSGRPGTGDKKRRGKDREELDESFEHKFNKLPAATKVDLLLRIGNFLLAIERLFVNRRRLIKAGKRNAEVQNGVSPGLEQSTPEQQPFRRLVIPQRGIT